MNTGTWYKKIGLSGVSFVLMDTYCRWLPVQKILRKKKHCFVRFWNFVLGYGVESAVLLNITSLLFFKFPFFSGCRTAEPELNFFLQEPTFFKLYLLWWLDNICWKDFFQGVLKSYGQKKCCRSEIIYFLHLSVFQINSIRQP